MLSLAPTGPPDMARPAPPGRAGPPAAPGRVFAGLLADEAPPPGPGEIEAGPEQEADAAMAPEEGVSDRPGPVPVPRMPGRGPAPAAAMPAGGREAVSRPAGPIGGDSGGGGHPAQADGAAASPGGAAVVRGEAPLQSPSPVLPPGPSTLAEDAPLSEAVPAAAGPPERADSAGRAERRVVIPPPPPSVARQMAAAIHAAPEGQVTLRLSPEELGQVTLQLRGEGDRMMLSVAAEQADTAELIRRHQQELTQAFRALGYRSVTLSFEAEQDGGHGGQRREDASPVDPAPDGAMAGVTTAGAAAPRQTGSALDLRL